MLFLDSLVLQADLQIIFMSGITEFNAGILTVRVEVARHSFLMRGIREFFNVGYSTSSANVGMILRHSS